MPQTAQIRLIWKKGTDALYCIHAKKYYNEFRLQILRIPKFKAL